ncbi:hypothetical protein [Caballeronia sp. LjRoot31]|uniref:hypothetical protein n=1 Tax=Caballeronia sp. LjRoot31 TaxID=3342324 RepID=UPI003ECE697F
MTLALVSPGASFEASNIGFIPPIADASLKLWHFFGSAAGPLGKNLVVGAPDSVVVGSPVLSPRYASFKGVTNYLQTPVSQTGDFTIIAVMRSTDTFADDSHRPMFISNYGGTRLNDTVPCVGVSLYVDMTPSAAPVGHLEGMSGIYDGTPGGASQTGFGQLTIADMTQWRCVVVSKIGATRILYDLTGNASNSWFQPANMLDDISSAKFRIGSSWGQQFKGICDMAMAALYSRGMTLAEVTTLYTFLKQFYARRNIAI